MAEEIKVLLDKLCDDPSSCRQRLLHAAGMLFAERGRDGVSTRELTKAAGANLSAIAYYFGGKDGLYNAALDYTIAAAQELLGRHEAALRAEVARAGDDRAALARAAARFVRDVMSALLGLGPAAWPKRLIMRELDHPSEAFERLFDAVFRPLYVAFRDLVIAATGRDRDDPRTDILTGALLGECLVFHRNQPVVLKSLGWDRYTPERIDRIIATVSAGILDGLDLPADALADPPQAARRDPPGPQPPANPPSPDR